MQAIYFDMDGTLADLYAVQDWEYKLNAHDETPYIEAVPLVDMQELCEVCEQFAALGITIGVISWLAMNSDRYYDARVRAAKREWLARHFPVADEVHIVKYGTTKLSCANEKDSILVDDNAKVRAGWGGTGGAIDATGNILASLRKVLHKIS